MAANLTKTEKLLFLLTAVFLAIIAGLYLRGKPSAGSDYTVTAQYERSAAADLVDSSAAGAEELAPLSGIGPELARRMIDHRTANGPFSSVDELLEVSGIGEIPEPCDGGRFIYTLFCGGKI